MKEKVNVSEIAKAGLCNVCGGCKWVCPAGAIDFYETIGGYLLPGIIEQKCDQCGLCISICPGAGFGSKLLANIPTDPFIGKVISTYAGRSADPEIYASALLQYLLCHLVSCHQRQEYQNLYPGRK